MKNENNRVHWELIISIFLLILTIIFVNVKFRTSFFTDVQFTSQLILFFLVFLGMVAVISFVIWEANRYKRYREEDKKEHEEWIKYFRKTRNLDKEE